MKVGRATIVFMSIGWLCCSVSLALGAPEELNQDIEQERLRLNQLKQEIKDVQEKAKTAKHEQDSILKTLQNLDQRLARRSKDNQKLNRKLKQKDQELEDISRRLDLLREGLDERRGSVMARLRVLYIEGRMGYVKAMLASGTYADFQRRFDYISSIVNWETKLLDDYRTDLEQIEQLQQQRTQTRKGMLAQKQKLQSKIKGMKRLKRKKRVVLVSITKEKDSYEQVLTELEQSAERVDALLKELEQRRKLAEAQTKKRPGSRPSVGSLIWPADGKVVAFFGRQKHPTFDAYVNRKGIDIQTSEGSAIRAVSAGTIVYADWLKGYGLVLIVDHRNGFFSLYAHASKLLVEEGKDVKVGQIIGETGETGMTEGSRLYFELRKGTQPVDPLTWLVKRP